MSSTGLISTGSLAGTRTSGVVSLPLVAMMCPCTRSSDSGLCSVSIHTKSSTRVSASVTVGVDERDAGAQQRLAGGQLVAKEMGVFQEIDSLSCCSAGRNIKASENNGVTKLKQLGDRTMVVDQIARAAVQIRNRRPLEVDVEMMIDRGQHFAEVDRTIERHFRQLVRSTNRLASSQTAAGQERSTKRPANGRDRPPR